MIVVQATKAADKITKPVICPTCKRGKIGNIPAWSESSISRRGMPPIEERGECVQVKCPKCGSLWSLTIE